MRKTACITGATSGIGAEFAKRFAKQGYDLMITGRRKEKIEALSNTLSKENDINAEVIVAELSDDRKIDLLAERIKKTPNLVQYRNPCPLGKVRVQWLCHLNDPFVTTKA